MLPFIGEAFGDEHPDTAYSMNEVGMMYFEQVQRRVLPEGHRDTLWSMSNLAKAGGETPD